MKAHLGNRPRLHLPDPSELRRVRALLDSDAKPPWDRIRTAGCFDAVPLAAVTLDPNKLRCHRCELYLKRHPQYRNLLTAALASGTPAA